MFQARGMALVSMVGLSMASECPETIFIGTRSRFAKGAGHVWRYQLSDVGAQRIFVCLQPPSTTHAGDVMFIVPQVEGETVAACCCVSDCSYVLGGWRPCVGNQSSQEPCKL